MRKCKSDFYKNILDKESIAYLEFPNGQLQVDKVNFWSTTESWYDQKENKRGTGFNSFLSHIKSKITG